MFKSFAVVEPGFVPMAALRPSVAPHHRPSGNAVAIRVIDIIVASVALVAFAPLMLLIAAMIMIVDGGPILFSQSRLGFGGRRFQCLKFRTMCQDADTQLAALLDRCAVSRGEWGRDQKLRSDPRIISGGAFLRRMSLDELPQLFNVLRGDMSIVGPRPIVDNEVPRYGRYYRYYCSVRPGITGLWQISGRNNVSYRRRVACDVVYARRKSASSDVRIIALTLPAVFLSRGAY